MITVNVYSLDVWGHGPGECCQSFGCSCVVECPDCDDEGCGACDGQGSVHDTEHHECDAGYDVNDRSQIGTIEFEDDPTDGAILDALKSWGWLKSEVTESDVEIEYLGDSLVCINEAEDGRPVFQLEFPEED